MITYLCLFLEKGKEKEKEKDKDMNIRMRRENENEERKITSLFFPARHRSLSLSRERG